MTGFSSSKRNLENKTDLARRKLLELAARPVLWGADVLLAELLADDAGVTVVFERIDLTQGTRTRREYRGKGAK